jgi:hypothetical protein
MLLNTILKPKVRSIFFGKIADGVYMSPRIIGKYFAKNLLNF